LVHCVNVDGDDLDLITQSGSPVAHCPKSNAKFGHGIAPLDKFLQKGIAVGLGSDSVASNNACDLIEEARFAALMARTVKDKKTFTGAEEMLRMMTLGGAGALGLENSIGSLEPGKQADLCVISIESAAQMPVHNIAAAIVFSSGSRDVMLTMVAGKEIYRDGDIINVYESVLKADIAELAEKMNS
jgi:5-methylthioadenosine/S-adenosylhomocysteine deaminase